MNEEKKIVSKKEAKVKMVKVTINKNTKRYTKGQVINISEEAKKAFEVLGIIGKKE